MPSWGKRHAEFTTEARAATHKVKTDNQNGKRIDKTIQAKGQAITNREDAKIAAKNARKWGH